MGFDASARAFVHSNHWAHARAAACLCPSPFMLVVSSHSPDGLQKSKKLERKRRQKEDEKALEAGLQPPPRKQQRVRLAGLLPEAQTHPTRWRAPSSHPPHPDHPARADH